MLKKGGGGMKKKKKKKKKEEEKGWSNVGRRLLMVRCLCVRRRTRKQERKAYNRLEFQ